MKGFCMWFCVLKKIIIKKSWLRSRSFSSFSSWRLRKLAEIRDYLIAISRISPNKLQPSKGACVRWLLKIIPASHNWSQIYLLFSLEQSKKQVMFAVANAPSHRKSMEGFCYSDKCYFRSKESTIYYGRKGKWRIRILHRRPNPRNLFKELLLSVLCWAKVCVSCFLH